MRDRLFVLRAPRLADWRVDVLVAVTLAAVLVDVRALEAHGLQRAGWLGYALSILAASMVSLATAKTYVSRAMVKLDARDRAQLVVLAYQTGLVLAGEI
jgi:hypothetical protein